MQRPRLFIMHRTNGGQLRFWPAGSDGWPAGSALSSSPPGTEQRSRKRARPDSASSPSADSNGSLGAAIGAQRTTSRNTTDLFQGGTANAYKVWLQGIDQQPAGKPAYASYIGAKLAQTFDNTGWGVGVVCCITADPRRKSTIRVPASDAIFSTKSQPHHLGGQHSFCGRSALLCLMRNFEQGLHQPSASTPTPTFNGARASGTVVSNGAAAHSSSSSLPSPQAHAPQGPAAAAAPARVAPTAGP